LHAEKFLRKKYTPNRATKTRPDNQSKLKNKKVEKKNLKLAEGR
jgi:hypothetical protein